MQSEQYQYERSTDLLRQALTHLLAQCSHLLSEQFDNDDGNSQNEFANNNDCDMELEDIILSENSVDDDDADDDNPLTIDIVPLLPQQAEITTAVGVAADERTPLAFSIYSNAFPFAISEMTDHDLLGKKQRSSRQQCQQQHRSSAILVYNLALAHHLWGLQELTHLQADDQTLLYRHHHHHHHQKHHSQSYYSHPYQSQPTQQHSDDSSNPLLLPFGKLNLHGSSNNNNNKDQSCFTLSSSTCCIDHLHKALELYEITLNLLSSCSAVSSSSSSSLVLDLDKLVALACFNNTGSIYEQLLRLGRGHHCECRMPQQQEEYATAKIHSCMEWIVTLLEACEDASCQSGGSGLPCGDENDHQEGCVTGNNCMDCSENHDDESIDYSFCRRRLRDEHHHHYSSKSNNQRTIPGNNPLLQPFYATALAWQVVSSSSAFTGNFDHHHKSDTDSDTRSSLDGGHIIPTDGASACHDHPNSSTMRCDEFASAA